MATKSGVRASSDSVRKASGTLVVEGSSGRPPPVMVAKANKSEIISPSKMSKHVQQVPAKVIANTVDESKPFHSTTKGSINEISHQLDSNLALDPVSVAANGNSPESHVVSSSAEVKGGVGNVAKTNGRADFVESNKSSVYRVSTSTDVSDESSCSSLSSINKPHKSNDLRWEAIQVIRARDGALGLNHFRLLKRLGCGDIGSVYLSELSGTKCYFAMKVMDKASLASRKKLPRAQTEREILQCLDHPFLPTLYSHFETDKFSCLVMEFCPGGDLHTLRQRQPGKYFTEQAVKYDLSSTKISLLPFLFYVAEILLAMEYLHMLGIIYRDLKPENVLVRGDGHIMLSDFDLSLRCAVSPTLVKTSSMDLVGLKKSSGYCIEPACVQPSCSVGPTTCFSPRIFSSKSKRERKQQKNEIGSQVSPLPELVAEPTGARSMSFVGTHEYLAPEIIKGEGHGSAVDWWTFGIFLYELLFGKTPFKGSGNRATLFNVVGQPLRFPESPVVSFQARDLIRGLLVKEPQNRLAYKRGATEVKQHPFFEGVNWALIRCASPPEIPRPVEFERMSMPPSSPPSSCMPGLLGTGNSVIDQKGSDVSRLPWPLQPPSRRCSAIHDHRPAASLLGRLAGVLPPPPCWCAVLLHISGPTPLSQPRRPFLRPTSSTTEAPVLPSHGPALSPPITATAMSSPPPSMLFLQTLRLPLFQGVLRYVFMN
ncbi:hypothetical protein V2J09_018311 [Rumex salicifolius]